MIYFAQSPEAVEGMAEAKQASIRMNSIRIRMTDEFKEWVEDVATRERMTVAAFIERSIVDAARRNGHPEPPER